MARHYDSDIDGFDRAKEQLIVRDRNINALLRGDFPANIHYLLTGTEPDDPAAFDAYLRTLQALNPAADDDFARHAGAPVLWTVLPKSFFNKDFEKLNRFFNKYARRRS